MSDLPLNQHRFASGIVAIVGVWVAYSSFTQEPAEAYLFPRLISSVFVVLALWTFAKACLGKTKVGRGLNATMVRNLLPGLLVAAVYIFWAAKALGFYTSTAIAFFVLLTIYDPAPHARPASWLRRLLATILFVGVMYGLFALLLKVYTPREILF